MKINILLLVLSVLLTGVSYECIAQDTNTKPLESFLHILENRFDVAFTYADENIQDITVSIPSNNLSLEEYLTELQKQTNLEFKRLDSRYIAIKKSTPEITVSGKVIDKNTRDLLAGAVLISGDKHAVSDNKGQFTIKLSPESDSVLTIMYVGYKQLVTNNKSWLDEELVFELVPDVLEIDEVVVNYIVKGIDKLPDGAIQMNMINLEILPGLSEPDVLHSVQVLPGIQSVNESVSDINIRGGTNDQNLVLWEGTKMYQTGHFFGLISSINSHLIHKSKVIKNGASVEYGEGVSGIIDMNQQDYLVNDFEASAGLNMISADAIVKIPLTEKISLMLGARHSVNNIVITPTYNSYYKRAFEDTELLQHHHTNDSMVDDYHDFSFYDLSLKFLYDISGKDKIRFSILHIKNLIKYEESALVNDTLFNRNSYLSQSSILSNFDYSRKWSDKHTSQFTANISQYSLEAMNVELVNEQHHFQKNDIIDWGLKLTSKYQFTPKINFLTGYEFDEIGIRNQDNINKPDYNRDVKDVLDIHSLFSELEIKRLFDRAYLRFGIRANYLHKFDELFLEPRAVLNVKLNDFISCEVLAEKKSQYTTQLIDFQTDFLGIEKRRWVLSNNKSVPVINSQQFSMGMQYHRNRFLISVEAYKKKVSGIITPSQGFQNQFQYVYAIGNYSAKGIEMLVDKSFNKTTMWFNYALAKNDYYFKEFTPSVFPNNLDIRHTISVGCSYSIKNLELSSGFNYRTGKPHTKPAEDNIQAETEIIYEEPNSSRLSDFVRLDISAKYKFNIKKVKGELGVSVWNVLNSENEINIFYQRNDNNEIEQVTQHALLITPNVNLRFRF